MFSWLMYYLGSENEDKFVTTAVKLHHPMFIKKLDHITAATIWQESNISKKSQRIVLRYLSSSFGTRLVINEYCIDKLGQNHVIPQCDFFSMVNNSFLDETYNRDFNYIS